MDIKGPLPYAIGEIRHLWMSFHSGIKFLELVSADKIQNYTGSWYCSAVLLQVQELGQQSRIWY